MKIAITIIKNLLACHYAMFGYRETLERMGHTVVELAFPSNNIHDVDRYRKEMPTIDQLNECDVVVGMYFEYTQPWLAAIYGLENWKKLKVPVILRMEESFDRLDLGLPGRWEELKQWGQHYSFPTVQDARKFGGEFVTYGADTTLFYPSLKDSKLHPTFVKKCLQEDKKYDIAFIGSMYQVRKAYLTALQPHVGAYNFHVGNCIVQDLGGVRARDSYNLLAENYRQIKIFFCLPPMSRMLVEKIFDVMACGTFVMYPRLPGEAAKNLKVFEDKKHLVYYEMGYLADNAAQIDHYMKNEDEREAIAAAGCKFVFENYTLQQMLDKILAPVKRITTPTEATVSAG